MVRLASIEHRGQRKLVAQLPDGGYCDLTSVAPDARAFLASGSDATSRAGELIDEVMLSVGGGGEEGGGGGSSPPSHRLYVPEDECRLLAPIDGSLVGKFICIGMNYADHCTEQNLPIPEEPVVFSKFSSAIVGPGDPVPLDETTTKLDYEVELGVVVGSTVPRYTTSDDVMPYVGGYTVVHDVSARDWQLEKNGGQWLLGKTVDGYAPIGPVIVTADEISDPHDLGIRCRVSGETLQDSRTSQLVHRIPALLEFLSRFMTLQPGDVIATGTPPGVGCFRDPPRWLRPGDVVECEIDQIGTLVSPIVEAVHRPGKKGPPPSPMTLLTSPTGGGRLGGMHCIVTGAARGIGYGIAARLGAEGAASVTVVDLDKSAVEAACTTLRGKASRCVYHGAACDVTDPDSVTRTWAAAVERGGGRLDVLVQAAGIVGSTNVRCEDVDPTDFDDVMRVNVRGIFLGCRAALPHMTGRGYGRIVNIASIAGKEGNAGMLAYSASKAAVIGLTKSIGKEYAETGVTCNAIAPAVVRTKMVDDMPEAQVKYMTDKIPMKRCGTIEEIASMVSFMASPESAFTTGFCFDASGGRAVY